MKNSYGNFFHPITVANRLSHTWETAIHPIINQLSEWISQLANAFTLFLAPLYSSFTEVCRVSTSLLTFSRKFAINHRQSSNRFIALDKPINHKKNYNFLACDWFKNVLFSTNSLAKLLSDSLLLDSLLLDSLLSDSLISQSHSKM